MVGLLYICAQFNPGDLKDYVFINVISKNVEKMQKKEFYYKNNDQKSTSRFSFIYEKICLMPTMLVNGCNLM